MLIPQDCYKFNAKQRRHASSREPTADMKENTSTDPILLNSRNVTLSCLPCNQFQKLTLYLLGKEYCVALDLNCIHRCRHGDERSKPA